MRRSSASSGLVLPLLACTLSIGSASAQERCYPGPPVYILRELLGGQFSPERYREAIVRYAEQKCSNGQTLKLVSPSGPDDQDKLNEETAGDLCDVETIYRERLAAGEGALVLFCLVSKLPESQNQ